MYTLWENLEFWSLRVIYMLAIHISAQINQVCSQMSINSSHGQLDVV